jgi:hypothetical protein
MIEVKFHSFLTDVSFGNDRFIGLASKHQCLRDQSPAGKGNGNLLKVTRKQVSAQPEREAIAEFQDGQGGYSTCTDEAKPK